MLEAGPADCARRSRYISIGSSTSGASVLRVVLGALRGLGVSSSYIATVPD